MAGGTIQLIDVRQSYEHEAGRIEGDRLIELGSLSAEAHTISRDAPVVFYCRSGARSAMATQAFAGGIRRPQHDRRLAGLGRGGLAAGARGRLRRRGLSLARARAPARTSRARTRTRDYCFHLIEQPTGLVSAFSGVLPASTASRASRSHCARWDGSSWSASGAPR